MTFRSLLHRLFHSAPTTTKETPVSLASEVISDIESRFSYHPPISDLVKEAHGKVRSILEAAAKEALSVAVDIAPWGAEAEQALKALDEAAMWLNAHIARNQSSDSAAPADVEPAVIPAETVNATPSVAAPVAEAPAPVEVAPVDVAPPAAPAEVVPETVAPVEAEVPLTQGAPVEAVAPVDPAQTGTAPSPFAAPAETPQAAGTVQVEAPAPAVVPEAPAPPAAAAPEYFTFTGDPASVAGNAVWPKADVQGVAGEVLYTHATSDQIDASVWVSYTGPTQPVPSVA